MYNYEKPVSPTPVKSPACIKTSPLGIFISLCLLCVSEMQTNVILLF